MPPSPILDTKHNETVATKVVHANDEMLSSKNGVVVSESVKCSHVSKKASNSVTTQADSHEESSSDDTRLPAALREGVTNAPSESGVELAPRSNVSDDSIPHASTAKLVRRFFCVCLCI